LIDIWCLAPRISEFIDFHLRPFVENLPSHIKDTTGYLKKMENLTIPENTTTGTMKEDVYVTRGEIVLLGSP
jgi:hypothetical protein